MLAGRWLAMALTVLLLAGAAHALAFRPSTIEAMDLTVTLEAEGAFSGTVYAGDTLEVRFLTLNNSGTQQIQEIDEKLLIGEKELKPTYKTEGSNKYAVFKIDKLIDYAATPKFRILTKARVKTLARLDSLVDYDLSTPMKGPSVEEFLKPSHYIESNDPELVSKARLEFASNTSELETIRQVTEWVNKNVTYDFENYYNGIWSAKQTYLSRRGVCDEFSNLAAAFLRARGIPTQYIAGVSFDGERFGNHGWLEVYLGGKGWIGVDPTYGEAGYLDAAHLELGKGLDANLLTNFSATTWSRKPLKVEAVLHDPVVEINEVKTFSGLLDVELETPPNLELGQDFEVKAKVRNRKDYTVIVPLELVLHEEFGQEGKSKLVLLRPFEEKTLSWKGTAPRTGLENQYARYGLVFLAPDQNIEETIEVYPKEALEKGVPSIEVSDISPFIGEDWVRLEVTLENKGAEAGHAELDFGYYGVSKQLEAELAGGEKKKFEFETDFAKPGKMTLEVREESGSRRIEIEVPKKAVEDAKKGAPVKIEKSRTTEKVVQGPPPDEWSGLAEQLRREAGALAQNEWALYGVVGVLVLWIALWVLKRFRG